MTTMHKRIFFTVHAYNVESVPRLWDKQVSTRDERLDRIAFLYERLLHGIQVRPKCVAALVLKKYLNVHCLV